MGLITGLLFNQSEKRSVALSAELMNTLRAAVRGDGNVTPRSAMGITSVFASVRVLAESVGSLPLILYERLPRGKQRATDHPLYELLHTTPNTEHTSIELRMILQGHVDTWGNGYAQIVRNGAGRPVEMWPLRPDQMTVMRRQKNGPLWYQYNGEWYSQNEILHLRGLGFDGVVGYSPITLLRRSLGLAEKMDIYANTFYENGAKPGVLLRHPGRLSEAAYKRLLESWEARHQGVQNAHRVAILEEGLDVETVGIPPQDAQFLESKKMGRTEIAAIFRVPPHMIGDLDRATFSNIEQQSLEYTIFTLGPKLAIWEQAITRDLIAPSDRRRYFAEHLVDGLLRGDTLSRYQAYQSAMTAGWMTANEARERENLNAVDGGDQLLQPLNMVPAGTGDSGQDAQRYHILPTEPRGLLPTTRADDDDTERHEDLRVAKVKLQAAMLPMLQDIADRLVRREVNDLRRAVKKHLINGDGDQAFLAFLNEFYRDWPDVVIKAFESLIASYAEQVTTASAAEIEEDDPGLTDDAAQFNAEYLEAMGNDHAASSRRQLAALVADAQADGTQSADYVNQRLDGWESSRAAAIARRQAVEMGNALAISAYVVLGVQYLRWMASGESCDFCQSLSGRIAGINGWFVQGGSVLDGGQSGTMLVRRNTRHGPLHDGCDCVVIAA